MIKSKTSNAEIQLKFNKFNMYEGGSDIIFEIQSNTMI